MKVFNIKMEITSTFPADNERSPRLPHKLISTNCRKSLARRSGLVDAVMTFADNILSIATANSKEYINCRIIWYILIRSIEDKNWRLWDSCNFYLLLQLNYLWKNLSSVLRSNQNLLALLIVQYTDVTVYMYNILHITTSYWTLKKYEITHR